MNTCEEFTDADLIEISDMLGTPPDAVRAQFADRIEPVLEIGSGKGPAGCGYGVRYVTVVTRAKKTAQITKRFFLDDKGKPDKEGGAIPAYAFARTVRADTPRDLEAVLQGAAMSHNKALILGYVPGTEDGQPFLLMSSKELIKRFGGEALKPYKTPTAPGLPTHGHPIKVNARRDADGDRVPATLKAFPRFAKAFVFSGWALLDHDPIDPDKVREDLTDPVAMERITQATGKPDKLDAIMSEIWPGYVDCGFVRMPSSSSRVFYKGKPYEVKESFHTYIPVDDLNAVDNLSARMFAALGANGYTAYVTDKNGNGRLRRTLIDMKVLSRERLVYAGAPRVSGEGFECAESANISRRDGRSLLFTHIRYDEETRAAHIQSERAQGVRSGYTENGRYVAVDTETMSLDDVIPVKKDGFTESKVTVREFWDEFKDNPPPKPLRCQAIYRGSTSWNGGLGIDSRGRPFLLDWGEDKRYYPRELTGGDDPEGDFDGTDDDFDPDTYDDFDPSEAPDRADLGKIAEGTPRHDQSTRVTVQEAEQAVLDAFARWSPETHPGVSLIKGEAGLGKTKHLVGMLKRELAKVKAEEAKSEVEGLPGARAAVFVPNLKLAHETCKTLQAGGINAAVMSGYNALENPFAEADKKLNPTMCLRPADAKEVQKTGRSVRSSLCEQRDSGGKIVARCPKYKDCGRYALGAIANPDVWVCANNYLLFEPLPSFAKVLFAVVDEDPQSLFDLGTPDDGLTPSQLNRKRAVFLRDEETGDIYKSEEAERFLVDFGVKLGAAMLRAETGTFLKRTDFDGWKGDIAADIETAIKYENARVSNGAPFTPDMDGNAVKAAAKKYAVGGVYPSKYLDLWEALQEAFASDLDVFPRLRVIKNGGNIAIKVLAPKKLSKAWGKKPTLLLDATPRSTKHLSAVFGREVEVLTDVRCKWSDTVTVTQIVGGRYSKSGLIQGLDAEYRNARKGDDGGEDDGVEEYAVDDSEAEGAKNKAKKSDARKPTRLLRDIANRIVAKALKLSPDRGKVAVVSPAAVEDVLKPLVDSMVEDLPTADNFPVNIQFGHFGAIAGTNRFQDADALFVIGQETPSPAILESIAAATFNRPVARLKESLSAKDGVKYKFYEAKKALIGAKDGVNFVGMEYSHPYEDVNELLWRICYGEILQAAARIRPLRRRAKCELILFSNLSLDLPVTNVVRINGGNQPILAKMAAKGFVTNSPLALNLAAKVPLDTAKKSLIATPSLECHFSNRYIYILEKWHSSGGVSSYGLISKILSTLELKLSAKEKAKAKGRYASRATIETAPGADPAKVAAAIEANGTAVVVSSRVPASACELITPDMVRDVMKSLKWSKTDMARILDMPLANMTRFLSGQMKRLPDKALVALKTIADIFRDSPLRDPAPEIDQIPAYQPHGWDAWYDCVNRASEKPVDTDPEDDFEPCEGHDEDDYPIIYCDTASKSHRNGRQARSDASGRVQPAVAKTRPAASCGVSGEARRVGESEGTRFDTAADAALQPV